MCIRDRINIDHPAWPSGYSFFHYIARGTFTGIINGVEQNQEQGSIFVAGVIDKQDIVVSLSGEYSEIVSDFTALGMYQLTGALGSRCQGRTNNIDSFDSRVRNRCAQFLSQCQNLSSNATSYDCLNYWYELLNALAQNPFPTPDYLAQAVAMIEQAKGLVKIKSLCETLGISERQFNRKFFEIVGIKPKYFLRILQVNHAIQRSLADDREYFSMIAASAGYADESHFIKAAKDFFKQPPKDFLNSEQDVWFEFLKFKNKKK